MDDFNEGLILPTLIRQLKSILDQYPDDGQILKEVIQNAEDAGATKVTFLIDHTTYGTNAELLYDSHLADHQGPALYVYNDAVFSEADWKGIRMLHESIKEDDPMKVGRFGLGFKSVFHMTDLPSVFSGEGIAFIDPYMRYFKKEINGERTCDPTSTYLWHLTKKKDEVSKLSHQFEPYLQELFGITTDTFSQSGGLRGTLFRFPFRRWEMLGNANSANLLSATVYDKEKIKTLVHSLVADGNHMLLFLNNIEIIEVYEKHPGSQPKRLLKVGIEPDYLDVIKVQRQEFQKKVSQSVTHKVGDNSVSTAYPLAIQISDEIGRKLPETTYWLVSQYYAAKSECKLMETDTKLGYLPLVGVAVKLDTRRDRKDICEEDPDGHIFCFLPLPLEKKSPTGLRVHVNGCFAIDQNRRHIKWPTADQTGPVKDPALLWNQFLVSSLLPKAMTQLTTFLIQLQQKKETAVNLLPEGLQRELDEKTKHNPEYFARLIYAIIPDITTVTPQWKTLASAFEQAVISRQQLFFSPSRPCGRWLHWNDTTFDVLTKNDRESHLLRTVLYTDNRNLACVPDYVLKLLPEAARIKVHEICESLLNVQSEMMLSDDDRVVLLNYVMTNLRFPQDIRHLCGLELLPLADGTWTEFKTNSPNNEKVYVGSKDHPNSLLPGLESHFLNVDVAPRLCKDLTKRNLTQLTNLDPRAVTNLMPKLFIQWKCRSEISKNEAPWIDHKWIALLWQYLHNHFDTTLYQMEDLHILPLASDCTRMLKLCKQLTVVSRTNPTRGSLASLWSQRGSALPNELITVCDRLGIYIINDLHPELHKHPQFFGNYAFLPTAEGMLQAMSRLLSIKGKAYVAEKILECMDEVRSCLRNFLAKGINSSSLSNSDRELLQILPIFVTVDGSGREKARAVSLTEVSIAAPSLREGKIPVQSPKVLLNLEDESSKGLAAACGVKQKSVVDIVAEVYFPAVKNGWYAQQDVMTFMKYFCENFKQFQQNYCGIEKLGTEIRFLQRADATYVRPCDVFDEGEKVMVELLSGQAAFPTGEFAKPRYRDALTAMGLRNSSSVTATEMHEIAIKIPHDNLPAGEKKKVADAFSHLLNRRSELLSQSFGELPRATLRDKLISLSCVPIVCKRVDSHNYPQSLAFYGEIVSSGFATPAEVKASKYANLVGSVRPLVDTQSLAVLAKTYGWNGEPDIKDVKQHLMNTIDCYVSEQKIHFLNIVRDIYHFLNEHKNHVKPFVSAMTDRKWIWNGDSFSDTSQVVLCKDPLDLKPYRFTLPSELSQFKNLWSECGLKRTSDLTEVLQAVSDTHEREDELDQSTVDRDIQLCVSILNILAKQERQHPESLLIPISTKSGKLQMKPATECTYVDKEWYQHDFDVEDLTADVLIIHELVPLTTAEQLNIPSLISRTLGVVELDIGFGQSEPLTRRLNAILKDYTDGLAVLKELMQNADDAGASEICFLYDERHNENARHILLDQGMKDLQGPALWTYNNAIFTDGDFESIVKLSGATKEKHCEKIGRFGLGFNAVYHLTDVPSFVSRGNIVFFDPHTKYLGRAIRNKSKPGGIKLNLKTHQHRIQQLTDQFKPYNGLFDCDISKDSRMESYEGTLFRFPLRTEEQARKSEISTKHYSDTAMMELLRLLEQAAHHILLYTQNVQLIKVFHLAATATSAEEMTLWHSVERNLVKVMRNVISPSNVLPKDTRKLMTSSTLPNNILQQCSSLMTNYKEKHLGGSAFCEFSAIYNIAVKYDSAAHTKFAGAASTDSDSYWLVVSCSGRSKSLELACKDPSLIPVGGAAAQLERTDKSDFKAVNIQFGLYSVGMVYCFLPLPIQFSLPVHINGFFAVHSSRTHLHERVAMDKEDKRAIWNEALMSDAVCQAYCILMEDLTQCSQATSYNVWPVAKSLKEIAHLAAPLYQSFYHRICTDENCAVVKADEGWVSLSRCSLLSPDFRSDEIAELALRVLKMTTNQTNRIVDIPEALVRTALEVESCRMIMQQKFIDKPTFFKDWFLPNITRIDALTRDTLVLSCLFDEKLKHLLTDIECIPVSPDGKGLKTISKLVHPNCKLAELYDANEGYFPLWKSGVASDDEKCRCIYDALVKLGMKKYDLSWEAIVDRCMVIQSNPSTATKRTKVIFSLMSSNLTRKLKISRSVYEAICRTKFLPVMKQPPNFPIRWKGDEYVLVSSKEGYLPDKTSLVCCSYPVIDQNCFGAECQTFLGLFDKKVELTTVISQICELQKAAATKIEHQQSFMLFTQVHNDVFYFLNTVVNQLNSNEKDVLSQLSNTNCVLVDKTLLMLPSRCAMTSIHPGVLLPYLAVVPPPAVMHHRHILKAIGVKDSFTLMDYVWLLHEVQAQSQGRKLTAHELELVIYVINQCVDAECRKSHPVTIPMENLPVPNAADWLCLASSLCYNNCPWLITPEDVNCCNQKITYPASVSIGIKTIRQDIMKRHRMALPFGQKERLVKRIKRIIDSYPFSEDILKEMLQNADDAGATTVHFICDTRSLKTEKVFDETWKAIQGPALCVYNDRSFTDKDLQGIQLLGEGSKSDDPVKTGQYGVGFNCVYHLTDVPSFFTTVDGRSTVLCAFDPNCKYVPGADSYNPGGMFQVTADLEKNFCDVFSGYFTKDYDISKNGTVFRLPLRTQDMAKDSEILQKAVTVKDIDSLFTRFRMDMYEALLFVNSVEEIRLRQVITGSTDITQLQNVYDVRVQLTEHAKAQRNFLQSKMQKAATKLKKKEKKICEIEMTEVVYEVTTEDSDKKRDVWQIVQRFGFEDTFCIPKIVSDAYQCGDLGLLPLGGVAYLKHSFSTGSTTATKSNRLFCFLPLPVQLPELPVHVNGHFILSSESRRGLWTDEHRSFKSEWNRCVMEGVVAPAYCSLIRTLKGFLINRNSDCTSVGKAKTELNKFHSVFPKISKTGVPYETCLTTAVYRYIGTENLDVLPLLSSAKQLQNVKWMGPHGQPHKKVYFDDLQSQMHEPEFTSEHSRTMFRSSGAIGIKTAAADQEQTKTHICCTNQIKQALMRCGFLLFACPLRLCINFEKADVPVQRIKPEVLLEFFASYNQHATQCKLGSVPCKLSETPLKEIEFVKALLKYCCRVEDYKQRLDGLPLLVTESLVLTMFNSQDRKYVTYYSDVAPNAPDMFVHSSIAEVLQLQPVEDNHLCQRFDVAEFSKLLPDILNENDYHGSEKAVHMSKLAELLRENEYSARWLGRVWSFFASFVPYIASEVQPDKANTETILMPVNDWCLLPVTYGRREMLVPICQSSAVLNLTEETPSEFVDILKTLGIAEVNWKYIDRTPHQSYFMKSLLGNIHQPQCVVSVFKNLLQQSTLEGALSMDKGLRLLAYFSENVAGLCSDSDTKDVISQLPFFVSKYNTQISINRACTYVLPTVPGDDMEIWREQLNVTFLMQKPSIEKLVYYLDCKCLTVVEAYTVFIFPHFNKLSSAGQKVHVAFVRDHLRQLKLTGSKRTKSEIATLTKAVKSLAFLPSQQTDGSLVTASNYYDIEHEVFKAMLPEYKFPPSPYCDVDWREFLFDCGIIHEVTEEMFIEFVTLVESKATEKVDDVVCQQSNILLKHFLQQSDIQSLSFLHRMKSVFFVQPDEVGEHLERLHPQHGIRDATGRLRFISLQHSVLSCNKDLIWTTNNILPPCVSKWALKTDHHKDRHHKFKLMEQLQVIVEPSPDDVVQHIKQLCTFVINDSTHDLHDEIIVKPLEDALKCVYAFLKKQLPLRPSVASTLSDIPFVCVTDSCRLIPPSKFATDILEEHEIKPYLNKFPYQLGEFVDLFKQVGTTKTPTMCQYAGVLEAIHDETGQKKLLPHESKAICTALKGMLELMAQNKKAQLSVPKRIYFPSRSDKLVLSSDIVYVDNESLLTRLRRFQKPLLVDFKSVCGLTNEEDVKKVLRKLPDVQQPISLSSMVKECLDEGCEDTDSDIANKLRNRLVSTEFRNGVQRIARHCLASKSLTPEDMKLTTENICSQMQKIRIIGKSEIKTYLEYEGERIANSEKPFPFFQDSITEDGISILQIYVQRNPGNLINLHCHIAKVINKAAECRLQSGLQMLTLITGCPLEEIDEFLTSHEIIKLHTAIKQFNPPVGSFVPDSKHCYLVQNVFIFETGWLVALEVDDPLDRGERGVAKYKVVEIIERLRADGESIMADRYRVKISTDGEELTVDASLLYAFSGDGVSRDILQQDDDDDGENAGDNMIVLRPPGSTDEPLPEPEVPSDFRGIINWLKRQLNEAWTLPEEQRRRIVKRLKLQFHPDKHPPEKQSRMTKVFQLLQNLVARLEQGRPIDDVDEDEASHASGTRKAYDDFMGERARSYRQHQNYYWQNTRTNYSHNFGQSRYRDQYADFFTNFQHPPNPQPAEAARWMRQANYDLEAANNDEAPEWACYKCYQAAEKALRAAHLSRDCDRMPPYNTTDLSQLRAGLTDEDLSAVVTQLAKLLRDADYLRYPHRHTSPVVPRDVIDEGTKLSAIQLATRLLELCQQFIDRQ